VTSTRITLDGRDVTTAAVVTAAGFVCTPTTPLAETAHRVAVEAYDAAGNRGAAEWQFQVDLSTWVTLTHPPAQFNALSTAVAGEAEPGVTVTLRLNESPVGITYADGGSGGWALADVALNAGANTLVATASDGLGHIATATRTVSVNLNLPWADARAQPETFSPGGAIGFTTFVLSATAPLSDSLASWHFAITGISGTLTQTAGSGAPVPTLAWDGQGLAEGAYTYTLAVSATNGLVYTTPPQQVHIDRTPPAAPVITWPSSGSTSDEGSIRVEGTAEPGTFITLLDGGWFTITLETPTDAAGRWAGETLLHGGANRIRAIAGDTTGVPSPPSNEVVVVHVVHPPLYEVGTQPPTVAAGDPTTLWADVRGDWPAQGAPTTAAWAVPPYGEPVSLTHTGVISGGLLWHWDNPWPAPGGLTSQDTIVYFAAVDGDNLSGHGAIGLAIRNAPPEPEITGPPMTYVTDPRVGLWGQVQSAEPLTVSVRDGAAELVRTRSTSWNPTVGVNWQAVVTLTGEGPHPLRAQAQSDFGLLSAHGPTYTLFLDLYPPTVTLAALPPYTNSASLDLTWQGDDGAGSGVAGYAVEQRLNGSAWADWASGGTGYTTTVYALHEEGVYGLRIRAADRAGHTGRSAAQSVVADRTPPTLTLALAESSPYAHISGDGTGVQLNALYYGPYTGTFTVTATAADALAGLDTATFADATSPGATYPLSGAASATIGHAYTFSAASAFSGTALITVTDRATNATTASFTLLRDATPPQVWLDAPARVTSTGVAPLHPDTFTVTWGATDAQSGLAYYDLDVSVDGGPWQRILTHTTTTNYQFTNLPGTCFTFRLTTTDHVSNAASVEARTSIPVVTKYYYHGGTRVAMRAGDVVYYLHADHLGSTSLTTDASGQVVARQLYHPYGTVRYSDGTLPTDFGFTGQRHDDTGLIFMHARYYDPALGRFVSADTLVPQPRNPQSLNRFSYALGNPLRYRDPTGHQSTVDPFVQQAIDYFTSLGWEFVGDPSQLNPNANGADLVFTGNGGRVLGVELKDVAGSLDLGTLGRSARFGDYGGSITRIVRSAERFANSSNDQLRLMSQTILEGNENGTLENALFTSSRGTSISANAQAQFNGVYRVSGSGEVIVEKPIDPIANGPSLWENVARRTGEMWYAVQNWGTQLLSILVNAPIIFVPCPRLWFPWLPDPDMDMTA
jgi:RHS repeat-associated protein